MLRGITEITGESAAGKTQLCIQLCLSVQLPKELGGLAGGTCSELLLCIIPISKPIWAPEREGGVGLNPKLQGCTPTWVLFYLELILVNHFISKSAKQ